MSCIYHGAVIQNWNNKRILQYDWYSNDRSASLFTSKGRRLYKGTSWSPQLCFKAAKDTAATHPRLFGESTHWCNISINRKSLLQHLRLSHNGMQVDLCCSDDSCTRYIKYNVLRLHNYILSRQIKFGINFTPGCLLLRRRNTQLMKNAHPMIRLIFKRSLGPLVIFAQILGN